MDWFKAARDKGLIEWPYPIRYGEETEVSADVLVLGGGISGCWAAISAAKEGASVVLVEKSATIRSGAGGSGCDHWLNTPNPCSNVSAEEVVEWELASSGGYTNALTRYIAARESYETLLELEKMGAKIRDTRDEFAGAPFRDEGTKFLFAYDYQSRLHFRVWGTTFKLAIYNECIRLGVRIFDRVMVTSLLTEGGRTGSRVIGATGIGTRTGRFLVFRAKATVNCLSRHQRNWSFSTEPRGISSFRPTQITGDGHAMAWRAGATFAMMERSSATPFGSRYSYPPYGVGTTINTWFPCSLVDARGKEVPWVDRDGRILKTIDGRCRPSPGQKFMGERATDYDHKRPEILPDLEERVRSGEFVLPFYADLPAMPEHERKAIWGLMVGEEGKTKISVYRAYSEAGFDPKQDMLQSYIMLGGDPMRGMVLPWERTGGEIGDAGGLLVDWDLMTTLEGLFAAGDAVLGGNYHYHAATTGRYAGRKAATFARKVKEIHISRKQVETEKERVYRPIGQKGTLEWKELNAAICRVMQNYCGQYKNEELLKIGLIWLDDLERNELPRVSADNPHKLIRTLEVFNILTCSQMIIHNSLARKASSRFLDFYRLDYMDLDPPDWHKWITVRLEEGRVISGDLSIDFWKPLVDNYERHK